jgi:hypothetical protein
MPVRSPLRDAVFKRWSGIEMDRPESMPPLREQILLFSQISGARGFHFLKNDAQRVAILSRYLYTDWRELSCIDSP